MGHVLYWRAALVDLGSACRIGCPDNDSSRFLHGREGFLTRVIEQPLIAYGVGGRVLLDVTRSLGQVVQPASWC